jgi:hypothetical protein
MKFSKIIIWGAKLDTGHTHAFVQLAIFRAAQALNLEVYWLDNRDNVDISFFDNALVITEQWLVFPNGLSRTSYQLPLNPSATYIVHYLGNKGPVEGNPGASMYLGKVKRLIDFRFATNWGIDGVEDKNYAYKFEPENYERISEASYFEKKSDYDIFYSIWATDLLPDEINFEDRNIPHKEPKFVFFGGTIRPDNQEVFEPFLKACQENNMPFVYNDPGRNPLPIGTLKQATNEAYLAYDARPSNHLANGYISCRILKNISYGQMGITNSKAIYDFFDQKIAYETDPYKLFYVALEMKEDYNTKNIILEQMKRIKEHHTYINRLQDMITAAEMSQ